MIADEPISNGIKFDGERFIPNQIHGDIELEHLHRYLLASELSAGKVILDIASGAGYGSAMLSRQADKVIGVDTVKEGDIVFSVSANAYGVRINESDLNSKKGRVGSGCRLANADSKAGKIVFGGVLNGNNELFDTTSGGKSIRISASDIREVGRGCRGVLVQKLSKDEMIVAATKIEVFVETPDSDPAVKDSKE